MRSMTATEAGENFNAVLDALEHGETVLLTRDGTEVGKLVLQQTRIVDRLAEVFERYPLDAEAADDLERAVRELRESTVEQEREWQRISANYQV